MLLSKYPNWMEQGDHKAKGKTRKRKLPKEEEMEGEALSFSFDDLNQDVLERILSWLPTSTFFRLSSVSKRWKSVANSATFHLACSQIPSRDPWFFMVGPYFNNKSIIFDSSERNWKKINHPLLLHQNSCPSFHPVASSGGLLCFHSSLSSEFIISNPVTSSCRQIPLLHNQSLHTIAMYSSHPSSYKLVLVSGELPTLSFRVFNSTNDCWGEEKMLLRRTHYCDESIDHTVYFLSKAGNVIATNLQRSPSKQYSAVIALNCRDEEVLYFLSSSGTVVACNLTRNFFFEYPRLLPVFAEYSIDLVECGGEMFVVVLSEFLESASLRVWRFDENCGCWHQISAMPPAMSHGFYGKKVDINCSGGGHQILICINSAELCSYVLCDLVKNEWIELPNCHLTGNAKDFFMSAFSFTPRIEASV